MNERVRLFIRTIEKILSDPVLLVQHSNKGPNGKFIRIRQQVLLTGVECSEVKRHFSDKDGWDDPTVAVTDYTPKMFKTTVRVTEFKIYKKTSQKKAEKESEPAIA